MSTTHTTESNKTIALKVPSPHSFVKPIELSRQARVPYKTVVTWMTAGHPRAGLLPSIDLGGGDKRHSFRVNRADWQSFLARLRTSTFAVEAGPSSSPLGESPVHGGCTDREQPVT